MDNTTIDSFIGSIKEILDDRGSVLMRRIIDDIACDFILTGYSEIGFTHENGIIPYSEFYENDRKFFIDL